MSENWGADHIPSPRGGINLVEALASAQHLPAEAIDAAVRSPNRVADAVLAAVGRAAAGEALAPRDQNLLFWGIHILGQVRDARLHAPLLRLLRLPADPLAELLGEVIATTLPRIVASTFADDATALEAAILDPALDEFARYGLFGALAFLTFDGRIDREQTRALLVRFDEGRVARAGDAAWTGWEEAIALLGFADLRQRVATARDEARLLSDADEGWFEATLADAVVKPTDPARFVDHELGYLEDAVAELDAALASEEAGEPDDPIVNPLRHVGRNDPCPCGSGRKYKKCCLGKETLPA